MEYEEELLKKIEALYQKSLQLKESKDEKHKREIISDIKYMALLISRSSHW
jgi:hypothetical protein